MGIAHAEFILFPQLNLVERHGLDPDSSLKGEEFKPGIDIFYSNDFDRLRLLAEFEILRGKPKPTMERLQLGWLINHETTFWLGRYHTPFGYWNTEYHHGNYLQSAITRPSMIDFGPGAPLTRHLTGFLVESARINDNNSALHYTFGLGLGPELGSKGLKELDILEPEEGKHKLGGILNVSYHPDELTSDEVGLFLGYMAIPGNIAAIDNIHQTVLGAFTNWEKGRFRFISEVYWVHNKVDLTASTAQGSFLNGSLQLEYRLHDDVILYSRIEDTLSGDNDPYLGLLPKFIKTRALIGTAYEFIPRQALKLEIADVHLENDRFGQVSLQWSAAFP